MEYSADHGAIDTRLDDDGLRAVPLLGRIPEQVGNAFHNRQQGGRTGVGGGNQEGQHDIDAKHAPYDPADARRLDLVQDPERDTP